MSEAKFQCPQCNREYRWKPELAGRQVQCKCGAKMSVPAQPPEEVPVAELVLEATPPPPPRRSASSAMPALPTAEPAWEEPPRRSSRGQQLEMRQQTTSLRSAQFACVSIGILMLAMVVSMLVNLSRSREPAMHMLVDVFKLGCFGVAAAIAIGRVFFIIALAIQVVGFIIMLTIVGGRSRPSIELVYLMLFAGPIASALYFAGLIALGSHIRNGVVMACAGICAGLAIVMLGIMLLAVSSGGGDSLEGVIGVIGLVLIVAVLTLFVSLLLAAGKMQRQRGYGARSEPEWQ